MAQKTTKRDEGAGTDDAKRNPRSVLTANGPREAIKSGRSRFGAPPAVVAADP